MSDMDQQLKRALGEQTDGVRVGANLAERAIARDRANRRRELGVTALAAGLVLAVAVPVGWGAVRGTTERPLPVGPSRATSGLTGRAATPTTSVPTPTSVPTSVPTPTSTPTSIPTLTADGAPAPVEARFATGPVTDTRSAPYVVGGVIHDGTTSIRVQPTGRWGALARLEGGRWLLTDADSLVTTVVDDQGAFVFQLTGTARVSRYGAVVAASDLRGNLRAWNAQGDELGTVPVTTCGCSGDAGAGSGPGYEVVGVVGHTVYANRGETAGSVAWDVTTNRTRRLPFRLAVVDAAQEAAVVPAGEDRTGAPCQELRDLLTEAVRWRLCGPLVFRSFSSDGAYLLATGQIDGLAASQLNPDHTFRYGGLVVVRTSDAAVVLEGGAAAGAGGAPVSYAMSDDGTLTVQVAGATGGRNLQRCTLDGACDVVAPARPRDSDIPEGDDPYVLATT